MSAISDTPHSDGDIGLIRYQYLSLFQYQTKLYWTIRRKIFYPKIQGLRSGSGSGSDFLRVHASVRVQVPVHVHVCVREGVCVHVHVHIHLAST
jgi:hypothetical protein